ncbi:MULTISPECIES: ABC transporter permease [Oceanotoga]|jgi:simple sugar transport system permease protein|uniref:ABC transporter permease n=1 Tax=Oceanotoga TaxID=1255275 RepID=UPI00264CA36D|nr:MULTISPECIES: ABC transporter permease [Oceanotoga]MDN5341324.1 simple sugar transport system permease protein [Oceanotoga sp.]MDO7976950.1 ABC transporter permease [Oceanotoga teriensis]
MDNKKDKLSHFFISNAVPIIFIILSAISIPISGFSPEYLIQEMIIRLSRNSFLVLSLLIPVIAGMGLNFGIVLGAMAGQIGLIFITDWGIVGISGLFLAMIISTPIAILLGILGGIILNRAKGRETVTSYILGFFINGVYQIIVLYGMGNIIPITNKNILLPRGYGIRNAIDLNGIRRVLDDLIPLNIGNIRIPIMTFVVIAILCIIIIWFRKTKLGQDMKAVGQDMEVARSSGIAVERTRILSIIISTVFAAFGQILFLQNIGTMNTYNSHEQIGMFSIAALLIGGASVIKATIPNAFLGIILFHMMFVVSPRAGKELIGSAMLGEFFRVFISYGIIAISLALHAWRRQKDKERARFEFRGDTSPSDNN